MGFELGLLLKGDATNENFPWKKKQKGKHVISQGNSTWSFNKYLLGPYYVPRNVLWAKDKAMKKTGEKSYSHTKGTNPWKKKIEWSWTSLKFKTSALWKTLLREWKGKP